MRVLVTGGAGFIGSHLVRRLLAEGHDVTVYDALTYAGDRSWLDEQVGADGYAFVHGDVCDPAAFAAAVVGHDAVAHLAAETHVDRSIVDAGAFVRTNATGTQVVLDVAREVGARVLHVSTDEVYGSVEAGASTEDDPMRPRSPYAASKAAGDLLALAHHATHALDVVVARPSNTFGPRQYPEKAIPVWVTSLLSGERAPLYGDGLHQRDWLAVEDCARGLSLVLRAGVAGTAYNLGGRGPIANRDLLERLLPLCGAGADRIEAVTDRPGHDRRYCVDSSRARALGWAPQADLEEALAETVAWYRAHEPWWRARR